VGVESRLLADVSFLNHSIWNIPMTLVLFKLVSSFETNASGTANIPDASDYLRVLNSTTLVGDINRDGKVDIIDVATVASAFGSYPGHPTWNVDADINHDNKVDILDTAIVAKNFGKIADSVHFDTGEETYLDSQGFANIPANATTLTFHRNDQPSGALIEFFVKISNETLMSNNLGKIETTLVPAEPGSYVMQVKLPSVFDISSASQTNITGLDASTNLVEYFNVTKRPIELSTNYLPSNATFEDDITMVANVFDAGLGVPTHNFIVEFGLALPYQINGSYVVDMGSSYTNSSGVATFTWSPIEYLNEYPNLTAYFVTFVKVSGTDETQQTWVRMDIDARAPTHLELLSSEVLNVTAGVTYWEAIVVRLVDFKGDPIPNRTIVPYVNGVEGNFRSTNQSGIAYWDIECDAGIYYWTIVFEGSYETWYHKRSNEVKVVVNVALTPVSVLFDVEPKEFKAGTELTLSARVINTTSGDPLEEGFAVKFYKVMADGSQYYMGEDETNSSGWAVLTDHYSVSIGVYTYLVNVSNAEVVIVSPTMIRAVNSTELILSIGKKDSGSNYFVSGMLLSFWGVPNKPINIFVNDTLAGTATTYGPLGQFNTTLNLSPLNDEPTLYNVKAVFEGDDPRNVTSYLYTPNGTEYAVCTTVHYGYEPAVNYASVTVEPTATRIVAASNVTANEDGGVDIAPPKTPEELQQEANASGWLSIWHEFTWWYPWYRLHIQVNINPRIHVGFNPILLGGEVGDWDGVEFFSDLNEEFLQELIVDMIGIFIGYVVAKGLSLWNWVGAALALSAKFILQLMFLYPDWNNAPRLLATGIANIILGFIALTTSIGKAFLNELFNVVTAGTMSALYLMYNGLVVAAEPIKAIGRTWVDGADAFINFIVAGIALYRYAVLT
jgi:hypothetical protein